MSDFSRRFGLFKSNISFRLVGKSRIHAATLRFGEEYCEVLLRNGSRRITATLPRRLRPTLGSFPRQILEKERRASILDGSTWRPTKCYLL